MAHFLGGYAEVVKEARMTEEKPQGETVKESERVKKTETHTETEEVKVVEDTDDEPEGTEG